MTRQEYIRKYSNTAISSVRGTGLFPSVTMAQAILESSGSNGQAGESTLARYFNNHFGVKAGVNWKGKKVNMGTREVQNGEDGYVNDYFRIYNDVESSYRDRNLMLKQNPAYTRAGVFSAATPEEQCDALQAAGYATDPNYAKTLKALINQYNLKSLDREAVKKVFATAA